MLFGGATFGWMGLSCKYWEIKGFAWAYWHRRLEIGFAK